MSDESIREGNFPVEYEKNLLKHRKHSYITYIIDHHHMPTCMCPTSVQRVKTCMFSTNYCVNWLHARATSLQPKKCCKLVAYWSLQATAHLQRCIRNSSRARKRDQHVKRFQAHCKQRRNESLRSSLRANCSLPSRP